MADTEKGPGTGELKADSPIIGLTISTTNRASMMYNFAAERFAKAAESLDNADAFNAAIELEKNRIGPELLQSSLSAVVMASLAVEAVVNELFMDAELFGQPTWVTGLSVGVSRALGDAWRNGVEWYSIPVKCQIALAIAGKDRLDFGQGSAQKMQLLIDLRNELVHHKPITVTAGKRPHESDDPIERKLAQQFLSANIWGTAAPFRWSGCLGSGCARWAYKTSQGFQKLFFELLGASQGY